MPEVLSCERCGREIEACAFCERAECGACFCYRCLALELKERTPQPHGHGG